MCSRTQTRCALHTVARASLSFFSCIVDGLLYPLQQSLHVVMMQNGLDLLHLLQVQGSGRALRHWDAVASTTMVWFCTCTALATLLDPVMLYVALPALGSFVWCIYAAIRAVRSSHLRSWQATAYGSDGLQSHMHAHAMALSHDRVLCKMGAWLFSGAAFKILFGIGLGVWYIEVARHRVAQDSLRDAAAAAGASHPMPDRSNAYWGDSTSAWWMAYAAVECGVIIGYVLVLQSALSLLINLTHTRQHTAFAANEREAIARVLRWLARATSEPMDAVVVTHARAMDAVAMAGGQPRRDLPRASSPMDSAWGLVPRRSSENCDSRGLLHTLSLSSPSDGPDPRRELAARDMQRSSTQSSHIFAGLSSGSIERGLDRPAIVVSSDALQASSHGQRAADSRAWLAPHDVSSSAYSASAALSQQAHHIGAAHRYLRECHLHISALQSVIHMTAELAAFQDELVLLQHSSYGVQSVDLLQLTKRVAATQRSLASSISASLQVKLYATAACRTRLGVPPPHRPRLARGGMMDMARQISTTELQAHSIPQHSVLQVWCHPHRYEQMLSNAIVNAVTHGLEPLLEHRAGLPAEATQISVSLTVCEWEDLSSGRHWGAHVAQLRRPLEPPAAAGAGSRRATLLPTTQPTKEPFDTIDSRASAPDEPSAPRTAAASAPRGQSSAHSVARSAGQPAAEIDGAPDLQPTDLIVHVCVRDQGVGVPPSQQRMIFQPFSHASPPGQSARRGGQGLGLHMASRWAAAAGGTMWASAGRPDGSGFALHLLLPLVPDTPIFDDAASSRTKVSSSA